MGHNLKQSSKQKVPVALKIIFFVTLFALLFLAVRNAYRKGRNTEWWSIHRGLNFNEENCPECRKLPTSVMDAVVHYATSNVTPQQTTDEIDLTVKVLKRKRPCNMLVFGLGFDSLMWNTLNYGGRTIFLEEDENWIKNVQEKHPKIVAYHVEYPTMVSQALDLLIYARTSPECFPSVSKELQLSACKLALKTLPEEVYATDWDVIMIDAPTGYFPEAPGRMQAIYSAAVMALFKKQGSNGKHREQEMEDTDIFVHDVGRSVEKSYSEVFLCKDNLVASQGRLWHFNIKAKPSATAFCVPPAHSNVH